MNLYTNSHQDIASERRKKQEYRNILQQQIKQRQKFKQGESRFKTEPVDKDKMRWDYSTKFQTLDSSGGGSAKTKRFSQHSVFLPSIDVNRQRRDNNTSRLNYDSRVQRHLRTQSYGIEEASMYAEDNDIQAIQAIAECEVIIQNLRKLRMASLSSMKRKMKNKSIELYTPRNGAASDNHQKHSLATRPKQSSAEQQVPMFRAYEPINKNKKQRERQKQRQKSRQKEKQLQKSKRNSLKLKDKIQKALNQFNQQLDQSQQASGQFNQLDRSAGSKIDIKEDSSEEMQNEESMKDNEQDTKNKNRQKILLKFLGKAKLRGAQLQQKIARRKKSHFNEQNEQPKAAQIDDSKDFGESRIQNNSKVSIKSLSRLSEQQSQKMSDSRYQNNEQDG